MAELGCNGQSSILGSQREAGVTHCWVKGMENPCLWLLKPVYYWGKDTEGQTHLWVKGMENPCLWLLRQVLKTLKDSSAPPSNAFLVMVLGCLPSGAMDARPRPQWAHAQSHAHAQPMHSLVHLLSLHTSHLCAHLCIHTARKQNSCVNVHARIHHLDGSGKEFATFHMKLPMQTARISMACS